MADELETVILDNFPLPPIPGPLPATFFIDIPPGSVAVFSTEFGKRPFRPLPNPVPVHAVRSGSEDDIRVKSCDLFTRYHSITETIITPPTNWQDLYYYFDAVDLWTEGAGFLFHVLGYIVKVNITKINYLEDFARKWSFSNEARLANMTPHQDMLSSLQTPDDLASFDYSRMTSNDKEILNSVIRWHCEAFQKNRISPFDASLSGPAQPGLEAQRLMRSTNMVGPSFIYRESQKSQSKLNFNTPIQMMVEAQKARYEVAADSYQHFGNPDRRTSPRLAIRSSQGRPMHWDSNGSQTRPVSNQTYRNRYINQSHGGQRGSFYTNPQQINMKNGRRTTESHSFPLDNYQQGANNRRHTASGEYQLEHSQKQTSSVKDSVYVLNPQKSAVSVHEETINVEHSNSMRKPSLYSAHGPQGLSFQRRDSSGRRENTNNNITVSDEARFRQNRKFDHVDSAPRSMAGDHFSQQARRMSWQEIDFKKVRTIYVTGFRIEASAGQQLEKLFSQCGEVTNVSVVDEKFCAFITFKDQDSALAAITQFDGHWTGNHKSLTVRYSKGTQKKSSPSNIDSQHTVFGSPARALSRDSPAAPNHNRGFDGHDSPSVMRITPPRSNFSTLSKPFQIAPQNTFEQPRKGMVAAQATGLCGEEKRLKIESFDLSSKPKYSILESLWEEPPSTTSRHRANYIHGPLRTPERRNSSSEQKRRTRHQNSNERSGQSTGKRSIGSESSRSQRKTPKKPKTLLSDRKELMQDEPSDILQNTISQNSVTNSLRNEPSLTHLAKATTRESSINASINTILPAITQSIAKDCVSSGPIGESIKEFGDSSQCSTSSLQMHVSATISSARSNSNASTGLDSCNILSQSSTACVDTAQNNIFFGSVLAAVSELNIATLKGAPETPSESKKPEADADLVGRQQKRKSKHKKKFSSQSKIANVSIAVDNVFQTGLENLPGKGVLDKSKAETKSHAKTDSSTSVSSSMTSQVMLIKAEPSISLEKISKKEKEKADSTCDTPGDSTPTDCPGGRSHRPKKSIQAKANVSNDIFRNIQSTQLKSLEDAQYRNLEMKNERRSKTPEPCKNSSSLKEVRPHGWEESRTPTRKPLSRSRNKQPDQKHSAPDRKENKSLPPTPIEILADPSNWPALGSTKLQDTKSGTTQKSHSGKKPLSERAIPSVPIRRDSMASVVSQSTQSARYSTTDISISPIPGASPLWPIVKRWDGRG